jgi:hypothetical protein
MLIANEGWHIHGRKPILIEFLTPLARCRGIPQSVLRAIVEVNGVHKILSDTVAGYRKGNTWARTAAMRQELFRSIEAPWAVSLDADVVTKFHRPPAFSTPLHLGGSPG